MEHKFSTIVSIPSKHKFGHTPSEGALPLLMDHKLQEEQTCLEFLSSIYRLKSLFLNSGTNSKALEQKLQLQFITFRLTAFVHGVNYRYRINNSLTKLGSTL